MAKKIPLFASIFLIIFIFVGIFGYFSVQKSLRHEVTYKLEAVLQARRSNLSNWLKSIEGDLSVQAINPTVHKALKSFSWSWNYIGKGGKQSDYLQRVYIDENPHPADERANLDFAADKSKYSEKHKKFHPYLRAFLKKIGYADLYLFDPKGNLVYSVSKERDFATNFMTGKWAKSDLGKAFQVAHENRKNPGFKVFYDYNSYAPSQGVPASFIATPVFGNGDRYMGVLAFRMPLKKLNELMQQNAGFG